MGADLCEFIFKSKMEPTGFPKTSAHNYHSALRKISKERKSHLLRCWYLLFALKFSHPSNPTTSNSSNFKVVFSKNGVSYDLIYIYIYIYKGKGKAVPLHIYM